MPGNEFTPEQRHEMADTAGRLRAARAHLRDRADAVDTKISDLLRRIDLSADDGPERERRIDALMGLCLVVDAARAMARGDVEGAAEAAESVGYYANRVFGAAG